MSTTLPQFQTLTAGEWEESESDGSRIVSTHFDAELKTIAKKKEKREKKIKRWWWKKEGGKGEKKNRKQYNTTFTYVRLPFVSLADQQITLIKLDLELNSWAKQSFEAPFLFVL